MTRLIDAEDIAFAIEENSIEMNGEQVIEVSCAKALIDFAPTVELFCSYLSDGEVRQPCIESPCNHERPQGKWIPVSEKLPEDMQRVLIWFEYYRYGDFNCMYQTYGFGYVCDGKWSSFINGETGWQDSRIIAWQPLPEPYKEVDND